MNAQRRSSVGRHAVVKFQKVQSLEKLEFLDADTDTDILATILADTSDTRDFLKLFLWQANYDTPIFSRRSSRWCRRRGMPVRLDTVPEGRTQI